MKIILTICVCWISAFALAEGQWIDLLEGGNLDQWTKDVKKDGSWVMEADGSVHLPAGIKAGGLFTKSSFKDFELVFEWKISEGGNSGIYYRAKGKSPEYQILDDEKHVRGQWAKSRAAALYDLFGRSDDSSYKPAGQWNTGKIVANGNRLQHWLNGINVVDVEVGSDVWNEKFAKSKFDNPETYGLMKGKIWLQDHGGEVWYRNMKVRELKSVKELK